MNLCSSTSRPHPARASVSLVVALLTACALSACADGEPASPTDATDTVFDASLPDFQDPCAGVEQCAIGGTYCQNNFRMTCAQDAAGCWVITDALNCADLGYACDPVAADCAPDESFCDDRNECETEDASSCEDTTTVARCVRDMQGCLVLQRQNCANTGTTCLERAAEGDAVCASDPCAGGERCETEGTSCDGDDIVVCATDATTGCLVAQRTSCADTAQTCQDDGTAVACVDPCSVVETCPSASYCQGDTAVTCTEDANGCLVANAMTNCAAMNQSCQVGGAGAACVASLCPQRLGNLSCANTAPVAGNTTGGTTAFAEHCGYDFITDADDYPGREGIYLFQNPTRADVRVTASGFTNDYDLIAVDGTGRACNPGSVGTACLDISSAVGDGAAETVKFEIEPSGSVYVILDRYETTGSSAFSFQVECHDIACGNGFVSSSEGCDDGNTTAGDGCSSSCTVETGYTCTGEPSSCATGTPGETCSNALPLLAGVETYSSSGFANDYDSYSGCGNQTASGADVVFTTTLDAGESVDVIVYPDFDAVLTLSTNCPSISQTCQEAEDVGFDGGSENLIYTNSTGSQQTVYVVVDGYYSDAEGTFDLDTIFY